MEYVFFAFFFVLFCIILGATIARILMRLKAALAFVVPLIFFLAATSIFLMPLFRESEMTRIGFAAGASLLFSMILTLFYIIYMFNHEEKAE